MNERDLNYWYVTDDGYVVYVYDDGTEEVEPLEPDPIKQLARKVS